MSLRCEARWHKDRKEYNRRKCNGMIGLMDIVTAKDCN